MNKKEKYRFKEYDAALPARFEKEKKKLLLFLPFAEIHHFGSTAVPGLGGKGILDIIVFVEKRRLSSAKKILEKKYELRPKACTDERIFFRKDFVLRKEKNRMHLHLTADKRELKNVLRFRDILRSNVYLRREYSMIKRNAAKKAGGDGTIYRGMKEQFINDALV